MKLGLNLGDRHESPVKLSSYLAVSPSTTPASVSRPSPGGGWGMLANDKLGDCVIAMMLHSVMDFALNARNPVPTFADQDAISVYTAITGYQPGNAATDNGAGMAPAIEYWQTVGLLGHKIASSVQLNRLSVTEMKVGIWEFVDVQLAVNLPVSVQGKNSWTAPLNPLDESTLPGTWGGHAIAARGFDDRGITVVTWGKELLMSWDFWITYGDSAFAVITPEQLDNTGRSVTGLDWDDLLADIKKLV